MTTNKNLANLKGSRIWDLPTRICHWGLTICLVGAVISVKNGFMQAHLFFGLSVFGLVLFRLLWGFFGSDSARFRNFIPRKAIAIWRCIVAIRQKNKPHIGHDALGGLATCVILVMLFSTPILGMFSNDEALFSGPLAGMVSQQLSDNFSEVHENIAGVTIFVIGFHITAVLFYWLYKKDNIIVPMVTGRKPLPSSLTTEANKLRFVNPRRAIFCLAGALIIVGIIVF